MESTEEGIVMEVKPAVDLPKAPCPMEVTDEGIV
jgi:hypothetical protein